MKKLVFVVLLFCVSLVGAVDVSFSGSSGSGSVSIDDVEEMYAFEINFLYSDSVSLDGSIEDIFSGCEETSYGSATSGSEFSIYGSCVDEDTTKNVSGDFDIADLIYSGNLVLGDAWIIYANGSEEHLTYASLGECGNGFIEGDEACDGVDLDGESCESLGFGTGTLACSDSCSFDSSGCSSGETDSGESGSGGGGSSEIDEDLSYDISFDPFQIKEKVKIGEKKEGNILFLNKGDLDVELSLSVIGLDDVFVLGSDSLILNPNEEKTLDYLFVVDDEKFYVGKILINDSENVPVGQIPVFIDIVSDNFLFDAKITLPWRYRTIEIGSNLNAQFDLLQVADEEEIDVVANYVIKDLYGNTYLEESETFAVLKEKSFAREFYTEALPQGEYVLALELSYPGAFATSSVQFNVVESEFWKFQNVVLLVLMLVVVVVGFIVIVWAWRRQNEKTF